jgi:hypothetical protein
MAVQKSAQEAVTRKVNREGQRWTEDRPGMTLRLPLDLREAITEESRVKGDLARIVLFALSHVEREKIDIMQTRKASMELSNPQLLHVSADARLKLKEWAKAEGVSVNAIVVSVLDEFFKRLKKSKVLREELRLEIRVHRGLMPSWDLAFLMRFKSVSSGYESFRRSSVMIWLASAMKHGSVSAMRGLLLGLHICYLKDISLSLPLDFSRDNASSNHYLLVQECGNRLRRRHRWNPTRWKGRKFCRPL